MIKKVFLSIAVLTVASLSSFAANDNKATDSKQATECCKKACGSNKDCNKGKQCMKDKAGFGMRAFEGIELTEAQKTQLEALRSDFKAKKDAEMKQKGDKKGKAENLTDEQKQQLRSERMAKRQQEQQEFNDKVKNILTPEQYTKYLDNTKKMAERKDNGMRKAHKGGKHAKAFKGNHHRDGKKGNRNTMKSQTSNNA